MAKSKQQVIIDNMKLIERWTRDGLTQKQIATNLRIGKTTFEKYKRTMPELSEALKKNIDLLMVDVENALVKRALGFEYEETKTYIRDESGKSIKYQEKTRKYYPPDVAACSILLKNKDKDENGKTKWSDNPSKTEIDREMAKLKKEVEEMKLF